ncbi:MAG: Calx-beta domain-containing protein [Gemmataceae bacterium]
MWLKNFFKSATSTPVSRRPARPRSSVRPVLDLLEDRAVPSYSAIDLGALSGGWSQATDVNASGQVVGYSSIAGGSEHAFLWQQGVMTDLGTLGGTLSRAYGVNDAGQVVGQSSAAGGAYRAFLLTPEDTDGNGTPDRWFRDTNADGANDLMRNLGTLGGGVSSASDVNNAGQVVGWARTTNASVDHAFRWQNGTMTDLGTLGGSTSSAAAINDSGQVTGSAQNAAGESRSFLWSGGTITDLGAGPGSFGSDINASGQVAGSTLPTWRRFANLWTPAVPNGTTGSLADLGVVPGSDESSANGLNDAGQVVGYSAYYISDESGSYLVYRPFLYSGGVMQDLNGLTTAGTDVSMTEATAINSAGQVVGYGSIWNPLTWQSSTHAVLMTSVGVGVPFVTIDDVTVTEGNSGTTNAVFTVRLSEPSTRTVTVNFATANGTALSGGDYSATSGTVTFAPGELARTISVSVLGDRFADADQFEYFYVALSNPGNAVLSDQWGIGSILDDEPRFLTTGVGVTEGNSGAVPAVFTVSLSNAYDQTVTVDYNTADYTATAGSDYLPVSGRLTFAPGETAKQVVVSVLADRIPELTQTFDWDGNVYYIDEPEYFTLNLLNSSSNAYAGSGWATGNILDDEPRISADPVTVAEGNAGSTTATVTVSLSTAYDQAVTVGYSTANGSALAGSDYLAASGSLTFAPGETTKSVPVTVFGDRLGENAESFSFNLSNASPVAFVNGPGLVTITDDEPGVYLTPQYDVNAVEGNAGSTAVAYTIQLTAAYDQPVTVSYATAYTGSAVAGTDYVATTGSVTFAPGETTKTFSVQVLGDTVYEDDETFLVYLSAASTNSYFFSAESSYVVILNDDPYVPTVSVSPAGVSEGNAGTQLVTFVVSLSDATDQTVTVNYATANGTAAAGTDYRSAAGTVTFAPGETSKTVTVVVYGDRLPEPDETFVVNLSGATNAVVGGSGVGTILDDEPRISVGDVAKKEGKKNQTTSFTFTISLSAAYDQPVTVSFRTADGTATTGDGDYVGKTGTITFAPGETTKTVTIEVKGDSKKETDEYFYLDLFGNSGNSLLARSRGLGTILNDD